MRLKPGYADDLIEALNNATFMDRRVAVEIAQEKTDRSRGEYPPRKDLQNGPTEDRKREEATDLTENQGIIKEKEVR